MKDETKKARPTKPKKASGERPKQKNKTRKNKPKQHKKDHNINAQEGPNQKKPKIGNKPKTVN